MIRLLLAGLFLHTVLSAEPGCPKLTRADCCRIDLDSHCFPRSCFKWINRYCPQRAEQALRRVNGVPANAEPEHIVTPPSSQDSIPASFPINDAAPSSGSDGGDAEPQRELGKCGTAERNYQPCTTRGIADKLFKACCDLYVPKECHSMCTYETDQEVTRNMLIDLVHKKECSMKHLSTILFCASQNRDNRKCCAALDLNAPQLQVGSRCLRLCDPSGTAVEKVTKDDVTCLYNWNVIMYCHHSGIREM